MDLLFDDAFRYPRGGLALVAVGMGAHLAAGTLNQAALARDRAGAAAACWARRGRRLRRLDARRTSSKTSCCGRRSATRPLPRVLCALLLGVYHRSSG